MIFRREESFDYSKFGKRKLSLFHARQLLYDYNAGVLDSERVMAMTEALEHFPSLKAELDNINYGLSYCLQLEKIELSEPLVQRMQHPMSTLGLFKQKIQFNKWPLTIRWFAEALLLAGLVSLVVAILPWHVVLNRIDEKMNEAIVMSHLEKIKNETPDPFSELQPTLPVAKLESQSPIAQESTPEASMTRDPETFPAPLKKPDTVTQVELPTVDIAKSSIGNTEIKNPPTSPSETQGILYRGTLYVSNLNDASDLLVNQVHNLEGKKAGGVPLGWAKENERYFHFTVPSQNLEAIQNLFKKSGRFKMTKEKHERLMPEGTSRVIISVYQEVTPAGP